MSSVKHVQFSPLPPRALLDERNPKPGSTINLFNQTVDDLAIFQALHEENSDSKEYLMHKKIQKLNVTDSKTLQQIFNFFIENKYLFLASKLAQTFPRHGINIEPMVEHYEKENDLEMANIVQVFSDRPNIILQAFQDRVRTYRFDEALELIPHLDKTNERTLHSITQVAQDLCSQGDISHARALIDEVPIDKYKDQIYIHIALALARENKIETALEEIKNIKNKNILVKPFIIKILGDAHDFVQAEKIFDTMLEEYTPLKDAEADAYQDGQSKSGQSLSSIQNDLSKLFKEISYTGVALMDAYLKVDQNEKALEVRRKLPNGVKPETGAPHLIETKNNRASLSDLEKLANKRIHESEERGLKLPSISTVPAKKRSVIKKEAFLNSIKSDIEQGKLQKAKDTFEHLDRIDKTRALPEILHSMINTNNLFEAYLFFQSQRLDITQTHVDLFPVLQRLISEMIKSNIPSTTDYTKQIEDLLNLCDDSKLQAQLALHLAYEYHNMHIFDKLDAFLNSHLCQDFATSYPDKFSYIYALTTQRLISERGLSEALALMRFIEPNPPLFQDVLAKWIMKSLEMGNTEGSIDHLRRYLTKLSFSINQSIKPIIIYDCLKDPIIQTLKKAPEDQEQSVNDILERLNVLDSEMCNEIKAEVFSLKG